MEDVLVVMVNVVDDDRNYKQRSKDVVGSHFFLVWLGNCFLVGTDSDGMLLQTTTTTTILDETIQQTAAGNRHLLSK